MSPTIGEVVTGLYCAGWIKRGPSGVIGTNKKDANETIELLLEEPRQGCCADEETDVADLLAERGVNAVSQPDRRRSTPPNGPAGRTG